MPASKARKAARQRQFAQAQKGSVALPSAPAKPESQEDELPKDATDDAAKTTTTTTTITSSSTEEPAATAGDGEENGGEGGDVAGGGDGDGSGGGAAGKKSRFIVFVGSLPYTATAASVAAHFARVEPTSVRLATQRDTGRSRGFAFLEFERYDRMKDCLRLYHHTLFKDPDAADGPDAPPPRRINIELTVGGGGAKSRDRKAKLRAKNDKLAEERKRKAAQRHDEGDGSGSRPANGGGSAKAPAEQEDQSGIHPSRRAMIQT